MGSAGVTVRLAPAPIVLNMPNIKKYRKKLRDREFIEVDAQIALWRKRLKKRGITIGKNTEKRNEINEKQNAAKALERAIRKRGFFG